MGDKTIVESLHRPDKDEAMVDNDDATADRCLAGWRGIHHPDGMVVAGHVVLLLVDGILKCHSRHLG